MAPPLPQNGAALDLPRLQLPAGIERGEGGARLHSHQPTDWLPAADQCKEQEELSIFLFHNNNYAYSCSRAYSVQGY